MKRKIFITGSTRGIGKSIAEEFIRHQDVVILHGSKHNQHSQDLIGKLQQKSNVEIYYFDVSDIQKVERTCSEIIQKFGHIDVLVNNAGIATDSTMLKMNYDDWDKVVKTNLYGVFNVTKQFLPTMTNNNKGRIINISSIVGLLGNYGQANYAASKAGVIGLTKSLAKELAKYNITVNAVCPGFTNTDMVAKIPADYLAERILKRIPLKRLAEPQEIAQLVYFLSSDSASYITGECFNITGGFA